MDLILGNFFSLLAMVSDSFSSSRKTVRSMLLVQCLGLFFFAVSSICLKGYSAAVQNVVSIFRNLLASSKYQSKKLEWFMVGLAVVLGLLFNNLGLIGALPVIGNLEYTLANGEKVKLLEDGKTYLGYQLEKERGDRCYGLVADERYLLVCEYGCNGADPEIVVYKRR